MFPVRVWGDEASGQPPKREQLVPIGIARGQAARGAILRPRQVTIIGDTPHDISCARTHGCRSLGVATGHFSVDVLRRAGADLAVADLRDTARIATWLIGESEDQACESG
jgi:phosphoglycolate phosphatase-like HAD superfamily hydrolase